MHGMEATAAAAAEHGHAGPGTPPDPAVTAEELWEQLLEERFGPRRTIAREREQSTSEQRTRRRVLLGLEEKNGTR